jgi:hypothetical protein
VAGLQTKEDIISQLDSIAQGYYDLDKAFQTDNIDKLTLQEKTLAKVGQSHMKSQ